MNSPTVLRTSRLCLLALLAFAPVPFASAPLNGQELQTLQGQVVDADGKPLSKVDVFLIRQTFRPFRQSALRATTDEAGRIEMKKFLGTGGRAYVRATACQPGYVMSWQMQRLEAGDPLKPLDFKLLPAREITFQAVDEAGKPIPRLQLIPKQRTAPDGSNHIIFSQSAGPLIKPTDEKGRVRFNLFNTGDQVTLAAVNNSHRQLRPVKIEKDATEVKVVFSEARTSRGAGVLPKSSEPEPAQVKWLADNSVRFRSIDPKDDQFEDLQPLKKVFGKARVVMLGEQSHRDGACFETKIRLIKFLHQEMGFDVLAFESGLYDCNVAWQQFQAGKDAQSAAQQGVFGIWTASRQVQPLFEYLASKAATKKPLELAGFDCQFTAAASRDLTESLREFVKKLPADTVKAEQVEAACAALNSLIRRSAVDGKLAEFQKTMDQLAEAAAKLARSDSPDQREALLWSQVFRSIRAQAGLTWAGRRSRPDINGRDEQMGKNLIWLAREFYPKRKIIVWAASFHLVRNAPTITPMNPSLNYDKTVPMGHVVHAALGDEAFSVGFTAGGGEHGWAFRRPNRLAPAPAGTLEDLFARAKIANGLVNFRAEGVKSIQPIYSRPLGYQYMKADWSGVFDAMIYNQKMTPSAQSR